MAKKKTIRRQRSVKNAYLKAPEKPEPINDKSISQTKPNLIDELYFGVAEKTVEESSYDRASQCKPYNSDDLYQKTNDYSIYEDMLKDDQVSVCMSIKKDLVIGSGWDIILEEEGELQSKIKDDIERALGEDQTTPFDDQLQELLSAFEFGFSLTEKVFKFRDDQSLSLKFLKTRHPSTWLIHTDKHGNVERYEQRGTSGSFNITPKSLIHYINQPKFQNPYGNSDLRSAYNAWFTKRQIIRFYAIFMEKAASPTPVAKYASGVTEQARTEIYNAIKSFQTKTAMVIPKEFEIEFLEAKSAGDVFLKGINIFNMFIGRSLVIPDLMGFQGSETSGGSYSLGKDQLEVLFKHIKRRRTTLEHHVNREIIWPLVAFNYGFVQKFPKFRLRPISDEHLVELARLWIEVVKGKIYEPNDEEINHFRKLAKFPEGDVILPCHSGMNPDGLNPEEPDNGVEDGEVKIDQDEEGKPEQESETGEKSEKQKRLSKAKEKEKRVGLSSQPEGEWRSFKNFDFPSGTYHKKCDFKAINTQMDRVKNRIMIESLPIVKRIYEDLFEQIEQKKIIQNLKPDRIQDLKLKHLKELKLVLKKNLRDAHKEAKATAQAELLNGNHYRTPLPDDKFLEVLDAELFAYIGDWAYNVTKATRITLMEAIRDGKPLSAVIDMLEQDGIEESNVSLERFSRTKITDVMNRGRLEFFNESGVVAAYQYSAILDDRTTDICAGLDGKIFQAGTEPVPPMHFNCRSLLIPITKYEDFEVDDKVGKKSIQEFIEDNKGDGFAKR